VIVCIGIISAIWALFVCRARRSSANLLNDADNKSSSSSASKDSGGTGAGDECPKRRSQELRDDRKCTLASRAHLGGDDV